jgi:hypothetical protein
MRILKVAALLWLCVSCAMVTMAQERPRLRPARGGLPADLEAPAVTPAFISENWRTFTIRVVTVGELDREVKAAINNKNNFSFYEVALKLDSCLISNEADTGKCFKSLPGCFEHQTLKDTGELQLTLASAPNLATKALMVVIKDVPHLVNNERKLLPLIIRFDVAPASVLLISASNPDNQRREVLVTTNRPIKAAEEITIYRQRIKLDKEFKFVQEEEPYSAKLIPNRPPPFHAFRLARKLTAGKEHDLKLDAKEGGLKDAHSGVPVEVASTISLSGGVPSNAPSPRISIALASVAGVHQKPIFEFSGKATLLKQPAWQEFEFRPTISFDIGFNSTRASNSILTDTLFAREFEPSQVMKQLEPDDNCKVAFRCANSYRNFKATPWHWLNKLELAFGPRTETDRNFTRHNVLGKVSLAFNFQRWDQSITRKQELTFAELQSDDLSKKIRRQFVGFTHGYRITPYIESHSGAHVNNEELSTVLQERQAGEIVRRTVTRTVPRHAIFRTYLGLRAQFEWPTFSIPTTLKLEEAALHLAVPEQVGFIVPNVGVFMRELKGFHHRGTAELQFALDPARHYSLTVGFENGRLAPNFIYLNRFTSGIKISY